MDGRRCFGGREEARGGGQAVGEGGECLGEEGRWRDGAAQGGQERARGVGEAAAGGTSRRRRAIEGRRREWPY